MMKETIYDDFDDHLLYSAAVIVWNSTAAFSLFSFVATLSFPL